MAKYTINQLPTKPVVGTDEIELQTTSGGLSGKTTVNDLKTYFSDSPTFTGTVNAAALATTGNTSLGDASTDTLNVGNGDLIKDSSGRLGIGVWPGYKLDVSGTALIVGRFSSSYTSGSKTYSGILSGNAATNQGASFGFVYDAITPTSSFWHVTPAGSVEGSALAVSPGGYVGIGIGSGAISYSLHVYNGPGCEVRIGDDAESLNLYTSHGSGSVIGTVNSTPLVLRTNSLERVRLDTNGYALIGYSSSNGAYKLQVNSQIFATNATIATSDARYKENVTTLTEGLSLVNALRPVSYTWKAQQDIKASVDIKEKVKDDKGKEVLVTVGREDVVKREKHAFDDNVHIGFLAQEVLTALQGQPYVNSIVKLNGRPPVLDADGNEVAPKEEFYGLAHVELIALLVKAVQELSAKVTTLEAKVK